VVPAQLTQSSSPHSSEPTISTYHHTVIRPLPSSPVVASQDSSFSSTSVLLTPTEKEHLANESVSSSICSRTEQDDFEVCADFVQRTCGCSKADGKPCSSLFSVEHFIDHRAQASLLTRQELDLVLLGSIMTTVFDR